jgi:hypothetical protein
MIFGPGPLYPGATSRPLPGRPPATAPRPPGMWILAGKTAKHCAAYVHAGSMAGNPDSLLTPG